MIPYGGARRTRRPPLVVWGLVAANAAAFVREASFTDERARERFIDAWALVPYDLVHGISLGPPAFATLVTAQFLHASVLHVFFNMLFLVVFGPRIEELCGGIRFFGFYVLCGVLGGLAQVWVAPGSYVPEIGASGAIAGVLGAYLLRFPTDPIGTVVPIGCFPLLLRLPAMVVIGLWAIVQFLHGFGPVTHDALSERGGGVAYFAHIGGFLAGVLLLGLFTKSRRLRKGPRARFSH